MNMLFFFFLPKIIHFIIEFKLDDKNLSLPSLSGMIGIHRKRYFSALKHQLFRNEIHKMCELYQELHNFGFSRKLELEARLCISI